MRRMAGVAGLITFLAIVVCAATAPMMTTPAPMKEYWQDKIAKPDQAWIEAYGYNDASILAFNVRRLYALCQAYQGAIQQLDAEVTKLEKRLNVKSVEDTNDVVAETVRSGDTPKE